MPAEKQPSSAQPIMAASRILSATASKTLLASCALSVLGLAAPALAQAPTVPTPPPTGDQTSAAAASNTQAGGDAKTQLPEVIVTATRQAQALSKVPESISAFTEGAVDVRGIRDISDISRFTPGLQFDANGFGDQTNIAIRGISSSTGSATTGIYIDDTPIQSRAVGYTATNAYPEVFDLDRIEVLRGPQGTLFGAGSEGGTVRFITPAPSLTKYSAYGRAEVSGTDGGGVNGEAGLAVGGPIVEDKLGFRVSAWYRRDSGYIDRDNLDPAVTNASNEKDANSASTLVVHAAVTWSPIQNLTITPSLFYQSRRLNDVNSFWQSASDSSDQRFVNGEPLAQPESDHFSLPALNVQYESHGVRFISNTSLFENRERSVIDYSTYLPSVYGIPLPALTGSDFTAKTQNENNQRVFTEEARLQSADPNARLNWVAGVFYERARQRSYETVAAPDFGDIAAFYGAPSVAAFTGLPLVNGTDALEGTAQGIDEQIAGFGEVNYNILPKLKLTAGVRVAQTKFEGSSFYTGPFVGGTAVQNPGSTTEHPVTPKFGATYQIDNRNLVYFTAAKGYRIGGVNAPVTGPCEASLAADGFSAVPSTYGSDSLWSYELGSKNRLFNNRLQIEASGYHIDWSNIQQLVVLSCGAEFDANLGQATSNGFDLQAAYRVTEGLTLEATTGYTDSQFSKSYSLGAANLASEGDHLETHPWTATLAGTYERELFGGYRGYFRADYEFRSTGDKTQFTDPTTVSYDPYLSRTPDTNFVSLRAGVRFSGVDVSLFVDNLTNAHPDLTQIDEVIGGPALGLSLQDITFRPRTVGLTAVYRY